MTEDGRRPSDSAERVPRVTDGHRTRYDCFEDLGIEVVSGVASAEGVEEAALPSLDRAVDTDALAALFAPKADGTPRAGGTITFDYAGHEVHVSSNGWLEIS